MVEDWSLVEIVKPWCFPYSLEITHDISMSNKVEKDEADDYLHKRSMGPAVRQWNITKLQMSRTNPREQDLGRTAHWYSQDLHRPILTDLGLGRQSAAVSWNWWDLHHCNESSENQAVQSHWLGWVCFCWCAWLEIAHQQRFRTTCALNTQQCHPISAAESQICLQEFWGSEINKIHPGIIQCLISISNSSIWNSRNLPLDKSGQYEDFTETNGDQRKPCWKLQSYPLGGLPSLKWNNYHLN